MAIALKEQGVRSKSNELKSDAKCLHQQAAIDSIPEYVKRGQRPWVMYNHPGNGVSKIYRAFETEAAAAAAQIALGRR